MLLAASLLQWVVWDTLFGVIVTAGAESDRRHELRQLMEKGDCSRPILDSADLRPLLVESVNRQLPYLAVMGRTLAALLAKDRENDEQHLNETLHSSSALNSVILLAVEPPTSFGAQPAVKIAQRRGDQQSVRAERGAADAFLSASNYASLVDDSSTTPAYFLQPNCTGDTRKFISWTAVISFAVFDDATSVDNEQRKGARRLLLLRLQPGRLDWNVCLADYLTSCDRNVSQCASIAGGGLSLDSYRCCCKYSPAATCVDSAVLDSSGEGGNLTALCQAAELNNTLRNVFLVINAVCALLSVVMVSLVVKQRKTQYGARGWALMELFLAGAALLYAIVTVEWLTPPRAWTCCLAVWLRELGFATFYGSIVLKIYRNLQEYRVRKAHHVYVKEQDLLKYLACFVALTATGLIAWTLGAMQTADVDSYLFDRPAFVTQLTDGPLLRPMPAPTCRLQLWSIAWQVYELLVLLYGVRLCYKARNSSWVERWQFTVAVCLETLVTLTSNIIRFSIRHSPHPDTTLMVSFIQLHLTVTINILLIMAPKFYYGSQDQTRRTLTMSGSSARAHPSLAKLRDNLVNGTIDFAEVPIADMNPEDIRAELKRVYTQLRMYKLKNIYQDNPHISKRKGGKKSSDKEKLKRRLSIPPASPQAKNRDLNRVEEDEKSSMITDQVTPAPFATTEEERASTNDLTVESSPHNIYLAQSVHYAPQKLHIEPDQSVRV